VWGYCGIIAYYCNGVSLPIFGNNFKPAQLILHEMPRITRHD